MFQCSVYPYEGLHCRCSSITPWQNTSSLCKSAFLFILWCILFPLTMQQSSYKKRREDVKLVTTPLHCPCASQCVYQFMRKRSYAIFGLDVSFLNDFAVCHQYRTSVSERKRVQLSICRPVESRIFSGLQVRESDLGNSSFYLQLNRFKCRSLSLHVRNKSEKKNSLFGIVPVGKGTGLSVLVCYTAIDFPGSFLQESSRYRAGQNAGVIVRNRFGRDREAVISVFNLPGSCQFIRSLFLTNFNGKHEGVLKPVVDGIRCIDITICFIIG